MRVYTMAKSFMDSKKLAVSQDHLFIFIALEKNNSKETEEGEHFNKCTDSHAESETMITSDIYRLLQSTEYLHLFYFVLALQ